MQRADILKRVPMLAHLAKLVRYNKRRAEGRLVEFDYPYVPQSRDWTRIPGGDPYRKIIARNDPAYAGLLRDFLDLKPHFDRIPVKGPESGLQPFWANDWLPVVDAMAVYGLLAKNNPRVFVEVGSGNSTKFAKRAVKDHRLRTKIISVDPYPRADIDLLCDQAIRKPLEDTDLSLFRDLGPDDILFIDNSHRSFQGSDVTVFFTEILPVIGKGCVYGIHDIFIPYDYPVEWKSKFYNEQYLLMAYLLGGANGDEIVLPAAYACHAPELRSILSPLLDPLASQGAQPFGASFWLRRG